MRAALIFVVLYLELTVAQIQLRVYRGNLVHSRELEQIEVLQDHLLGFDANRGEVSASACRIVNTHERECGHPDTQYQDSHTIHVQCSMEAKFESVQVFWTILDVSSTIFGPKKIDSKFFNVL